jgi:hypothetical protein
MASLLKLLLFVCVLCFVSLFVFSSPFGHPISFASAQTFPCSFAVNNSFYNLTSLSGTQINGTGNDGAYVFYLQLCSVAPACSLDGSMSCQAVDNDAYAVYNVAFPNDNISPHFWTVIPGGIQLDAFGSRLYCESFGNERKGIVQIFCDPSITTPPLFFSSEVMEGPPCSYTMTINHTAGCALPLPATSNAASVGVSGTDQSTVTSAGFGVGFLVGFIVAVALAIVSIILRRRCFGKPSNKWSKMDEDKNVNVNMQTTETTTPEATNM